MQRGMLEDGPLRRRRLGPRRQDAVDGEERTAGGSVRGGGADARLEHRLEPLAEEDVSEEVLGSQRRRRPLTRLRRRLHHPEVLLAVSLLRVIGGGGVAPLQVTLAFDSSQFFSWWSPVSDRPSLKDTQRGMCEAEEDAGTPRTFRLVRRNRAAPMVSLCRTIPCQCEAFDCSTRGEFRVCAKWYK
jgi:hypothetical protein